MEAALTSSSGTHPWLHIPLGFAKVYGDPRFFTRYTTDPETGLDGAPAMFPQARVLGGGGAINGMVYVRGQREDYDRWRQLGNPGWDADSVLAYFRKAERQQRGADAFHGADGPQHVQDIRQTNEICDAFIAAAEQCGIARNPDFNGASQEGAGYYQTTMRNGRRQSTAMAYLEPVRRRPNLKVETGAVVDRILFEGADAVGVAYSQAGQPRQARARRSVVLSSGAIGSPLLLQRSGVGPAALLRANGVEVIRDAPTVGRNLRNHYNTVFSFRARKALTLNDKVLRTHFQAYQQKTFERITSELATLFADADLSLDDVEQIFTLPIAYMRGCALQGLVGADRHRNIDLALIKDVAFERLMHASPRPAGPASPN